MTPIQPELLAIIVCPACRGELVVDEQQTTLTCAACSLAYPVREGIPVLLADEASPVA